MHNPKERDQNEANKRDIHGVRTPNVQIEPLPSAMDQRLFATININSRWNAALLSGTIALSEKVRRENCAAAALFRKFKSHVREVAQICEPSGNGGHSFSGSEFMEYHKSFLLLEMRLEAKRDEALKRIEPGVLQRYYLPDYEVGQPMKTNLLGYEEGQGFETALLSAQTEKLVPVVFADGEDLGMFTLLLPEFPALLDGYHRPAQSLAPCSMNYRQALMQKVPEQRVVDIAA